MQPSNAPRATTPRADAPRADFGPLFERLEDRTLLSAFEAHVNFQPTKAATPSGYIRDSGNIYGKRQGFRYGWNVKGAKGVDRDSPNSPDQRYDTFVPLVVNKQKLRWEIEVPSGTYLVHIVGGDPAQKGNVINIAAEGKRVVKGTTSGSNRFIEGTRQITVTDGRLTVYSSTGKGIGHKINFIDIVQITPAKATFEAEAYDASSGVFNAGSSIDSLDNGDWIRFDNLLFDGSIQSVSLELGVDREDEGNSVEFRLGSPTGQLIGTVWTQTTGGESSLLTQFADISRVSGVHDLYVVFRGDSEVGQLESFTFSSDRLIKVMPLGDSITEMRGGTDSYRRTLWDMLVNQSGYSVDFVGGQYGVRPTSGDPLHWDYDLDHEGHSGFRADQIRDGLPGWVADADPDVVLLHIGTNDLMQGQSVDDAIDEIGDLIDILRANNPNVAIVLAQIIPTFTAATV